MFNPVFEKHGILPTRHIIDVIFPPDMSLGPQYFYIHYYGTILSLCKISEQLKHFIIIYLATKLRLFAPLRCIRVSIFLRQSAYLSNLSVSSAFDVSEDAKYLLCFDIVMASWRYSLYYYCIKKLKQLHVVPPAQCID